MDFTQIYTHLYVSIDTYKKLNSNRKIYRTLVTKLINSIDENLKITPVDSIPFEENFNLLKVKVHTLFKVDKYLHPLISLNVGLG